MSVYSSEDIELAPFTPMYHPEVRSLLSKLFYSLPDSVKSKPTLIIGMSGRLAHVVSYLAMNSSNIVGVITPTCINLEKKENVQCFKICYSDVSFEYLSVEALNKYIISVDNIVLVTTLLTDDSNIDRFIQAIKDRYPLLRADFTVLSLAAYESKNKGTTTYSLTNVLGYWKRVSEHLDTLKPIGLCSVPLVDRKTIEPIVTDFNGQFYNGFNTCEYRCKIPTYINKIAKCLKRKHSVHKVLVLSPPELSYLRMHVANMLEKDYPMADIFVQSLTPYYIGNHYKNHTGKLESYFSGCIDVDGSKTCLCNPSGYDLIVVVVTGINIGVNALRVLVQLLKSAGNYNIQIVN